MIRSRNTQRQDSAAKPEQPQFICRRPGFARCEIFELEHFAHEMLYGVERGEMKPAPTEGRETCDPDTGLAGRYV